MRSLSAHRGYRIWVFIDETGWIKVLQRMGWVAWGVALHREYCAVVKYSK